MEKNNKLIAEFMGLPTEVFNSGNLNYYFKEFNSGTWYEEHELSYNISWDWLMPVVAKIVRDEDYQNYGFMEYHNLWMMHNVPYGCIDEVYEAVVTFIKSFNTKKKGE